MTLPDAQPPTLVDFLLARLAEDEAVARSAMGGQFTLTCTDELVGDDALAALGWVEHAKRHDPARVLAEVSAKRRIVELATSPEHQDWGSPMVNVLAALAIPYLNHPDCREEWKQLAADA